MLDTEPLSREPGAFGKKGPELPSGSLEVDRCSLPFPPHIVQSLTCDCSPSSGQMNQGQGLLGWGKG